MSRRSQKKTKCDGCSNRKGKLVQIRCGSCAEIGVEHRLCKGCVKSEQHRMLHDDAQQFSFVLNKFERSRFSSKSKVAIWLCENASETNFLPGRIASYAVKMKNLSIEQALSLADRMYGVYDDLRRHDFPGMKDPQAIADVLSFCMDFSRLLGQIESPSKMQQKLCEDIVKRVSCALFRMGTGMTEKMDSESFSTMQAVWFGVKEEKEDAEQNEEDSTSSATENKEELSDFGIVDGLEDEAFDKLVAQLQSLIGNEVKSHADKIFDDFRHIAIFDAASKVAFRTIEFPLDNVTLLVSAVLFRICESFFFSLANQVCQNWPDAHLAALAGSVWNGKVDHPCKNEFAVFLHEHVSIIREVEKVLSSREKWNDISLSLFDASYVQLMKDQRKLVEQEVGTFTNMNFIPPVNDGVLDEKSEEAAETQVESLRGEVTQLTQENAFLWKRVKSLENTVQRLRLSLRAREFDHSRRNATIAADLIRKVYVWREIAADMQLDVRQVPRFDMGSSHALLDTRDKFSHFDDVSFTSLGCYQSEMSAMNYPDVKVFKWFETGNPQWRREAISLLKQDRLDYADGLFRDFLMGPLFAALQDKFPRQLRNVPSAVIWDCFLEAKPRRVRRLRTAIATKNGNACSSLLW